MFFVSREKWFRSAPHRFTWILRVAHWAAQMVRIFCAPRELYLFTIHPFIYLPTQCARTHRVRTYHIYLYLRIHLMRSNLFSIESHALTAESKWISHRWRCSVCAVRSASDFIVYYNSERFTFVCVFFFASSSLYTDEQLDLATSLRFVSVSLSLFAATSKNPFKAAAAASAAAVAAHIVAVTENQ